MAVSLEQFSQQLSASGLMAAKDLASFQAALSGAHTPNSGDDLARELVRAGKLTKYQASAVLQGKIKGLRFGEYVVLDKLGTGGMGVVLKAQHRRMERTVAVKVLPAAAMKDPATIDRFYREVKAAAKLFHPNIVTALDAGEHEGMHFLVMEYVEGRDLSAVVSERGALGVKEAVECIIQAARGLEYAHKHGVVHRDIKPANLLWAKDGTVKILDMGLARLREEGLGGTEATAGRQLTQSGQIMGTVDYMSPEQAEDTRKADHRADIYSLGCTLYRLVTAANPFEGETLMQKLLAHREKPIPSLTEAPQKKDPGSVLPGLVEQVNAVFQKMLAKRPEERQQSMGEVIAELQAAIAPAKAAPPKRAGAGNSTTTGAQGATGDADQFSFLTAPAANVRAPAARPESDIANVSVLSVGLANSKKHGLDKRALLLLGLGGGIAALLLVAVVAFFAFGRGRAPVTEKPIAKKPSGETPKTVEAKTSLPVNQAVSDALAGKFALEFDGKSYVEIPTLKLTQGEPCTIEFFLSDCGVGKTQNVFDITGDGASARLAYTVLDGGQINWTTYAKPSHDGVTAFYSALFPSWKGRHHAAFLFSNEKNHAGFYVDGKPIDSPNKKGFGFGTPKHSGLLLGARRSDGEPVEFLIGRLAGVRVSRTLRYTRAFEPPAQLEKDGDTLALYRFTEGSGDTLNDASGNNHHGKIVGAKWVKVDAPPVTAPTSSAGKVVDLLPLIDPEKDVIGGKWTRLPTGEIALSGEASKSIELNRIEIPYQPPAEYDFTVEFLRTSGHEAITQIVRVGDKQLMWTMGGWANTVYGFQMIDGNLANKVPSSVQRPNLFNNGQWHTGLVQVRKTGLTAYFDGAKLVDQSLNFTSANLDGTWTLRDGKALGLGSGEGNQIKFRKVQVTEISGSGTLTRAAPTTPVAGKVVDLLPLIDPVKDRVQGKWERLPPTNALACFRNTANNSASDRLEIPYHPPEEYDFTIQFIRQVGNEVVGQIICYGDKQIMWNMGAWANSCFGFEMIDGKKANAAPGSLLHRTELLTNEKPHTSRLEVRKTGITAYFDDQKVVTLGPNFTTGNLDENWKLRDPKALGLGSYYNQAIFLKIEVKEISGPGVLTRAAGTATASPAVSDVWLPPINLGPVVNGPEYDASPGLSADELALFFSSKRESPAKNRAVWMTTRASPRDPLTKPVRLRELASGDSNDAEPELSADGLTLYFVTNRSGGPGRYDIWAAHRTSKTAPFEKPVPLSAEVNGAFDDGGPSLTADGRTLIFHSNREGGQGEHDLWQCSRPKPEDPFGKPVNLGAAINSPQDDFNPAISGDGLKLVFMSKRADGSRQWDLWMCQRSTDQLPFSEPVNLGPPINSAANEGDPWLSPHGERLYFSSDRAGGQGDLDLWMSPIR